MHKTFRSSSRDTIHSEIELDCSASYDCDGQPAKGASAGERCTKARPEVGQNHREMVAEGAAADPDFALGRRVLATTAHRPHHATVVPVYCGEDKKRKLYEFHGFELRAYTDEINVFKVLIT